MRVFEGYNARTLAWACSRVAVSVWEPCMAMASAVRPRCRKMKQQFKLKTQPSLIGTFL